MPNKYINVRINEERFCTQGVAEFSLLDMDALSEDGYVVKQDGVRESDVSLKKTSFPRKTAKPRLVRENRIYRKQRG